MNRIRPYLIFAGMALAFSLPLLTFADTCPAGMLSSPVCNLSVSQLLERALRVFVLFMIPVLTVSIIWAGLSFVLARGNPDKLIHAKWNFTFVIIGTILILGAWTWANLLGGIVTDISH